MSKKALKMAKNMKNHKIFTKLCPKLKYYEICPKYPKKMSKIPKNMSKISNNLKIIYKIIFISCKNYPKLCPKLKYVLNIQKSVQNVQNMSKICKIEFSEISFPKKCLKFWINFESLFFFFKKFANLLKHKKFIMSSFNT